MGYYVTLWEDAKSKNDPSDYDGIIDIHIKSISEIRTIFFGKPKRCTMITLERTGKRLKRRDGSFSDKYQVRPIWEKNNPAVTAWQRYIKNVERHEK